MKPYNQIVDIELTTDQVLLVLAMISVCTANIGEWMKQNPNDKESIDEIADTVKEIRKLKEVFDNARTRIEESWRK